MKYKDVVDIIEGLISLFVAEQYTLIHDLDNDPEALTPEELQESTSQHGGKMTMPPKECFDKIDIYETDYPNRAFVDFDLWFDNQPSSWTLQCVVAEVSGEMVFEVKGVRIL